MFERQVLLIEKIARQWWGMLMISAFFVLVTVAPVLFGFKTLDGSYPSYTYSSFAFYAEALSNGDSMLWNPHVFSGFPVFISLAGFFSPLHRLLLVFLSFYDVYALLIFFVSVFALFFTGEFLKELGVSPFSSFVGGIVWMITQAGASSDLPMMYAVLYLPLLFFLLLKMQKGSGWRLMPVVAFFVSLMWFTSFWHFVIEILLAAEVFAFYLSYRKISAEGRRWSEILNPSGVFFLSSAGLFLGTLIGFVQLIPTTLYILISERALGASHWYAITQGYTPLDIIRLFLPFFSTPWFPTVGLYFGILPLLYIGFIFSFRRRGWVGFFMWFFAISLMLGINYSPFFWLLHHLPPITFLHGAGRWMFLGAFALSALAAFGMDEFIRRIKDYDFHKKAALVTRIFGWFVFVIFSWGIIATIADVFLKEKILGFAYNYFDAYLYAGTTRLPLAFYHAYIENQISQLFSFFSFLAIRSAVSVFFLVTGYFFLRASLSGRVKISLIPILSVLIIAVNFIAIYFISVDPLPSAVVRRVPDTALFIQNAEKKGRFLSLFADWSAYARSSVSSSALSGEDQERIQSVFIVANRANRYGIDDVSFFEPLSSSRMSRLTAYIGGGGASGVGILSESINKNMLAGMNIPVKEKLRLFQERKNVLNFSGTRFIISSFDLDEKYFKKVFETKVSSLNIPVFIYENDSVRPLFYFASFLETIPENEEVAFEKLKIILEEGLGVFVECGEVGLPAGSPTSKNWKSDFCKFPAVDGKGKIEVKTKKNTVSILKTKSETAQFLVFSENNLPGWKVYVDGFETPIYTVGSVYMGIVVPEGEHEVRFEFTYRTIIEEFVKMIKYKF